MQSRTIPKFKSLDPRPSPPPPPPQVGYLSFLKIGPTLLRLVPGDKARDLRNWLTFYSFWNQGGADNVESAFLFLGAHYLTGDSTRGGRSGAPPLAPPPPRALAVTPDSGCYHPDRVAAGLPHLSSPTEYLAWYRAQKRPPPDAPVVAVLLYRKHVVTKQPYLEGLVRGLESQGLLPIPIFINGVEAHTVVRDSLTTEYEQAERAAGRVAVASLDARKCVLVDAVVSTIGFPLVRHSHSSVSC